VTFLKVSDKFFNIEETGPSRVICAAVEKGMWPWKPTTVDLMLDFDIDFNKYRLLARARGNQWDFAYTVPIDRDDLLDTLDGEWIRGAYEKFIQGFRNRHDWAVPNNIELGEN
jgi:hypothetical protein